MNKYTPTTDEVRDAFAGKGKGYANSSHYERQGSEFDRWLTAHDAQVVAELAASEVEWGTAVSDDPETIVQAKSEQRARSDVDGWNSRQSVARGESSRGILYRRTVGPWIEVTE